MKALIGTSATAAGGTAVLTESGGAAVGVGEVAVGGAAGGLVTSTGGMAAAAVVGWGIGTYGGVQIAKVIGLPTTGDWLCDAQVAFWSDTSSCALKAGADWVVNGDVVSNPAGWSASPSYEWISYGPNPNNGTPWWAWQRTRGTATVSISDADPYGSHKIPTVTYSDAHGVRYLQTYCRYNGSVTGANCGNANAVFDHFQFQASKTEYSTSGAEIGTTWYPGPTDAAWAYWYPVGHPSRPADPVLNPSRMWVTTWQCSNGTGGTASSASFHETDASWPAIPQAACEGAAITHTLVQEIGDGGLTTTIVDWTAPAPVQDWAQTPQGQRCAGGGCDLLLSRVDTVTGARVSCQTASSVCADWWTQTSGATAAQDQYECTFGGDVVALSECTVYAHAFDQGVYSDPGTGEAPAPATPTVPQDESCPPPFTWTSMINPWWYYKGAVCAMQKVFVPSTALQTSKVTTAWNGSALGQVGGVVSNLGAGFGAIGGGECGVITDSEPVPLLGWHLVIDTCAWPWSAAGPLKRIIGIAFLLGAIIIGVRTVLRIIRADVVVDGGGK